MRVLQVIDSLALGGAEVLLSNLAPALVRNGVDCEIAILTETAAPLKSTLQQAGITVHSTGVPKLYSPSQVGALRAFFRGYDLIHIHLFPAQLWAIFAARGLSIPLVTTEHNTWNARRRWWLRPFDAWMYPHYHRIACNSEATADELIRWCPNTKDQIAIIPNGIPLAQFEDAQPASLPEFPGGPRIVFVGRFEPQKDHACILRALALVPNTQLLFVGDGPLRTQLQEQARDLGIAERVIFLGARNDVANVLKASDIYVHSTTSDGFGIAACEAMATGLPVLASDVPGLAQVVGPAGILFPVGDHVTLARELNSLLSSPQRLQQMSTASRAQARLFGIENTAEQYIQMYEAVLRQPTRASH